MVARNGVTPVTDFADKVSFENVKVIRKTAAALLCRIDGQDHWIPQSQIDDDSEVYDQGHEGTLIVSEWVATQKGLT